MKFVLYILTHSFKKKLLFYPFWHIQNCKAVLFLEFCTFYEIKTVQNMNYVVSFNDHYQVL